MPDKSTNTAQGKSPQKMFWCWLVLCLAVYFLRLASWSLSELWYDEVLSLQLFCRGSQTLGQVFRNYLIANNHILMNALNWCWLHLLGDAASDELLLRLPAIACGAASLLVMLCHWRKFLGPEPRIAALGALLVAASPVAAAFNYQMRGYALAMLLSTVMTSGLLELVTSHHHRRKGQFLLCLGTFLLPLVMPSAFMVTAVPAIYLIVNGLLNRRRLTRILLEILPFCLTGCLGMAYYLTIWSQFRHAAVDAGGWSSSWLVAAQLLLAATAHLCLLGLPLLAQLSRSGNNRIQASQQTQDTLPLNPRILILAIALTAAVPLILRAGGNAPFPRVFLPLLPFLTCAAICALTSCQLINTAKPLHLALAILLPALLITIVTDAQTVTAIRQGQAPQDLLRQYYRGADDNRQIASFLADKISETEHPLVLVNPYDAPTFSLYAKLPQEQLFISNRSPQNFYRAPELQPFPLYVIARNDQEAQELFAHAGYDGAFQAIFTTQRRTLYSL